MFGQLLEILQRVGAAALPWTVVNHWERAVVLRLGKFQRELEPGFHWTVPFIDQVVCRSVVTTTTALKPQSVTTSDGKVITAEAVVRWNVSNIRVFALDIWDGNNVIIDSTQGAIASALRSLDSNSPEIPRKILTESRKALAKFGITVEAVTLTTLAPVRVIRLIGVQPATEPVETEAS